VKYIENNSDKTTEIILNKTVNIKGPLSKRSSNCQAHATTDLITQDERMACLTSGDRSRHLTMSGLAERVGITKIRVRVGSSKRNGMQARLTCDEIGRRLGFK
jgi:hypothetical protein